MCRTPRLRRPGSDAIRAVVVVSLIVATCVPPASSQQSATIQGGILDPSGQPAVGFRAVFEDTDSGTEYRSDPSNEAGEYRIDLPSGSRYRLKAVLAPDGTPLQVQTIPPLPVRVPGTYQLDVRFKMVEDTSDEEEKPAARTPDRRPAPTGHGTVKPWYKKPGGVIGIIAGVGVVAAAAGGGGGGGSASASEPQ